MELFPQQIKDCPQWAICGFHAGTPAEKQPYVWDNEEGDLVPLRKDGTAHGRANLDMLMSFEDASRCIKYYNQAGHNLMMGFYLMPSDPFCCIDMDIKDEWTVEEREAATIRYQKITEMFYSYTEASRSGNGLHLWVYAIPQAGKRRDGVEIYSQYRFIICTGNHWDISPLAVAGAAGTESEAYIANMLHLLMSEMTDISKTDSFDMREFTEEEFDADPYAVQDQDLYIQLSEQENGTLFKQLWEGRWDTKDVNLSIGERVFPSQSEAEFALIDFLCFRTKYNFQVRRLFMYSPMSARYDDNRRSPGDKIKKPYHLERMIKTYRYDDHMKSMSVMQVVKNNVADALERAEMLRQQTTPQRPPMEVRTSDGNYTEEEDGGLAWPPGFLGEIARSMYFASLYPVKDICILSALALFSGMCGKSWNTFTRSGLNNYFALIAKSGIGKEAFRGNIEGLLNQVSLFGGINGQQCLGVELVLDSSTYASDAALRKGTVIDAGGMGCNSVLNYKTETGTFFRNAKNEMGKAKDIMDEMLSLYDKGNFFATSGGSKHSNKENTTSGGRVLAYSFAGETTPDEFYGYLDDRMMANGIMSRFIVWECYAQRPLMNRDMRNQYPDNIINGVGEIYRQAVKLSNGQEPCYVYMADDAVAKWEQLDVEVQHYLNKGDNDQEVQDEMLRQLYNRKSLKLLRIASLLAIADNNVKPVISMKHYEWAESFIDEANARMIKRYNAGDIGANDSQAREKTVLSIIDSFLSGSRKAGSYSKYAYFKDFNIVAKSDIATACRQQKAFRNTRNDNVVQLIDGAILGLLSMNIIQEVSHAEFKTLLGDIEDIPKLKCYIVDKKLLKSLMK